MTGSCRVQTGLPTGLCLVLRPEPLCADQLHGAFRIRRLPATALVLAPAVAWDGTRSTTNDDGCIHGSTSFCPWALESFMLTWMPEQGAQPLAPSCRPPTMVMNDHWGPSPYHNQCCCKAIFTNLDSALWETDAIVPHEDLRSSRKGPKVKKNKIHTLVKARLLTLREP